MSVQITMQGTVKAGGRLELDDPVAMPEGRVQVTILPMPDPAVARPRRTILDVLDLFTPSNPADDDGGGVGAFIILPLIAAGFVTVGALAGCSIGLLLGGIFNLAAGIVFRVARMKLGRGVQP